MWNKQLIFLSIAVIPMLDNMYLPKFIGHRGYGAKEYAKPDKLPENTIQSFLKAYKSGIEMVEFDVQITSDSVPVIYHDWRMFEGFGKQTIDSLTLKEFQTIGTSHAINYPTLRDLFNDLPSDLAFNIEIKYPLAEEIELYKLNPKFTVKDYVEIILKEIKGFSSNRSYFISSFHPEVCLISSRNGHPTFFLTTGGIEIVSDPRCNSIEAAIKFCLDSSLLGIVSDSKPLLNNSSLIEAVLKANLKLATYGALNNQQENVEKQLRLGVHSIILDETSLANKQ